MSDQVVGPPQRGDLLIMPGPIERAPAGWTVTKDRTYAWRVCDGSEPDLDRYPFVRRQ